MNNLRTLSDNEADIQATPTRFTEADSKLHPRPPSPSSLNAPSLKGQTFGEYEILDELGQGGMGRVYKARHIIMDKIVAVKTIKGDLFQSQEAVSRFLREARAAGRVVHPNVVAAHHAGKVGDTYYLVMEYVEGANLQQLVRDQGPLSLSLACSCIGHAAAGLAFAHRQGIIHRDVKPSNLMLVGRRVKVLDLGLARFVEGGSEAEEAAVTSTCPIGTPDYMSPEQCRDSRQVDARTDIYSLGCTLYFLCVGQHLFGHLPSVFNKLVAHLQDPTPSLRQARVDVPQRLENIYLKMMAKRPEDRFSTMEEVVEAIKGLSKPGLSASESAVTSSPRTYIPAQTDLSQSYSPDEGGELKLKEDAEPRIAPELPISMLAPSVRRIPEIDPRPAKAPSPMRSQRQIFGLAAVGVVCSLIAGVFMWLNLNSNSSSKASSANGDAKTRLSAKIGLDNHPAAKKLATKVVDAKKAAILAQEPASQSLPSSFANAPATPSGPYGRQAPSDGLGPGFTGANPRGPYGSLPTTVNSLGMAMVHVPHGAVPVDPNFSEATTLFTVHPNGQPPIEQLHDFWLGAYEVTQKQYQQLISANPSANSGSTTADHPVDNVSWFDAIRFCNALSLRENLKPYYETVGAARVSKARILGGSGYRLPTDAEWEHAWLANSRFMPGRQHSTEELDAIAWHQGDSRIQGLFSTHPVGQKQANAFGLYDLKGNVWEWCQPWMGNSSATYSNGFPLTEWMGKSPGILRGGSFRSSSYHFRDPSRIADILDDRQPHFGFRVARDGDGPGGLGRP